MNFTENYELDTLEIVDDEDGLSPEEVAELDAKVDDAK